MICQTKAYKSPGLLLFTFMAKQGFRWISRTPRFHYFWAPTRIHLNTFLREPKPLFIRLLAASTASERREKRLGKCPLGITLLNSTANENCLFCKFNLLVSCWRCHYGDVWLRLWLCLSLCLSCLPAKALLCFQSRASLPWSPCHCQASVHQSVICTKWRHFLSRARWQKKKNKEQNGKKAAGQL